MIKWLTPLSKTRPLPISITFPSSTNQAENGIASHIRLLARTGVFHQVYFGITGLKRYGYDKEADLLPRKFTAHAQGLMTDGSIHKNYNPLTGEVLNSPDFGWSSALILWLLLNQ